MLKKFLFILLVSILLSNCAQQVAPNGGPKDISPPKITGYRPENKSINFKEEKIVIRFDEFVQIKDPSQIVISPFLKEKPTVETNGKSIEIRFLKEKPVPRTTYTINFGNSIADVNEGNVYSNFTYVFSTGNFLDSTFCSGSVHNAFNREPEKDIIVGLYKKSGFSDSTLHKVFPSYFGKTGEGGLFVIENLPNDTFLLIAFKDGNGDNKYQTTELAAFFDKPVCPGMDSIPFDLSLFEPSKYKENTIIDTVAKQRGKYQLVFYRAASDMITINTQNKVYRDWVNTKAGIDTLNIYIPEQSDSIPMRLTVTKVDTGFSFSLKTKSKARIPEFILQIQPPANPSDSLVIHSSVPIDSFPLGAFQLKEDTNLVVPFLYRYSNTKWIVKYPFKEKVSYSATIPDSAIKNVYGRFNQTISATFAGKSSSEFGTLKLSFQEKGLGIYIIQLVEDNTDQNVVRSFFGPIPETWFIENLNPGNYKLKFIADRNNNKFWDTGDYKKRRQPESVYYFDVPIVIKAFWDVEQSVNLKNIQER